MYRTKEHGANARELNKAMFKDVYKALDNGQMLGFAPEGASRFLPFMAKPLKTGVARIAYETVSRNLKENPDFQLKILPTGITFTHREKFRSDVVVFYDKPIIVDASWMEGNGRFDNYRDAIKELTKQLEESLHAKTINCPDWETTKVAMTAARLHRPLGTKISLGEYIMHLRGWVEILKPLESEGSNESGAKAPPSYLHPEVAYLRKKLLEYQELLISKRLKTSVSNDRVSGPHAEACLTYETTWDPLLDIITCASLFSSWAPTGTVEARMKFAVERPTMNDSVAEMKMLYNTVSVTVSAVVPFLTRWYVPFFVPPLLYLTIRFYEDGVASARSFYTLWKLLFLYKSTMAKLRSMRRECKSLVTKMASKLPEDAMGVADKGEEVVGEKDKDIPWYRLKWYEWTYTTFLYNLIMRRQKIE